MKKIVGIILVLSLVAMFGTSAMAASSEDISDVTLTANQKSEQELVNDYLISESLTKIPDDAIVLMDKSYKINKNKSDWDIIVEYIETGKIPEKVKIIFGDGTIELSLDVGPSVDVEPSLNENANELIQPRSTYIYCLQ